jgi:nitroreductase
VGVSRNLPPIDWKAICLKHAKRHPPSTAPTEPTNPAELEFLTAIVAYKQVNRRAFPSWSEVLDVLLALGYRKESDPPRIEAPRHPRKGQAGFRDKHKAKYG